MKMKFKNTAFAEIEFFTTTETGERLWSEFEDKCKALAKLQSKDDGTSKAVRDEIDFASRDVLNAKKAFDAAFDTWLELTGYEVEQE